MKSQNDNVGRLPVHLEQSMRFQQDRVREIREVRDLIPPKKPQVNRLKPIEDSSVQNSAFPIIRQSVSASALPSQAATINHSQASRSAVTLEDANLKNNHNPKSDEVKQSARVSDSLKTHPKNEESRSLKQNGVTLASKPKDREIHPIQPTSTLEVDHKIPQKKISTDLPKTKVKSSIMEERTPVDKMVSASTTKLSPNEQHGKEAETTASSATEISLKQKTTLKVLPSGAEKQIEVDLPTKKSKIVVKSESSPSKSKQPINTQQLTKIDEGTELQKSAIESHGNYSVVKKEKKKDILSEDFYLGDDVNYNPTKREKIAMLSQLYEIPSDGSQISGPLLKTTSEPNPPSFVDEIISKRKAKEDNKRTIKEHHLRQSVKEELKVHTENIHYVSHLQHKAASISGAPSSSISKKEGFTTYSTGVGSDEADQQSSRIVDTSTSKQLLNNNVQLAKHMEEVQLQLLQESNTISSLMNRIVEQHEALKELNTSALYHRKELGMKVEEINNNYIQLFEEMLREVMKVQRVKFKSQTKLVEDLKKANDRLSGELHLRMEDIDHLESEKKEIILEKGKMAKSFETERDKFHQSLAKLQEEYEFKIKESNNFSKYKLEENEKNLRKELTKQFTNELKEQLKAKEIHYQSQINQLAIDVQKRQQEIMNLQTTNNDLQEKLEKVLAGKGIVDTKALFQNIDKISFKHPSVDVSTQTIIDFQEEGLWDKQNGWLLPISKKNALVRSRWRKAYNYARCPSCRGSGQFVSQIANLLRQCVSGDVATNVADSIRTGKKSKSIDYRNAEAITKSPSVEIDNCNDSNLPLNTQSPGPDNSGIACLTPRMKSLMFQPDDSMAVNGKLVTPTQLQDSKVKKLQVNSTSHSGSTSNIGTPRITKKKLSKSISTSTKQQKQKQFQQLLSAKTNEPSILVSHSTDTMDADNIPAEEQLEGEYQSVLLVSRDQLKDIDMSNCLVENPSYWNHYLQYSKIVIPDELMQFLSNLPHAIQAISTQSLAWTVAITYSLLEHKITADRDDRSYNFPRQSMSLYMISHMLQYIPYNRIYSEFMIYIYMKAMRSYYKQSDLLCIMMRSIGMLDEYNSREKQLLDDWKKSGEKALQKKRAKAAEAMSVRERAITNSMSISSSSKVASKSSKVSGNNSNVTLNSKKEKEKANEAEKSYVGMSIYDEEYRITSHAIVPEITEIMLFARSCLYSNNYQGVYKSQIAFVKQNHSTIFEEFETFLNDNVQRSLWKSIVISPGVYATSPEDDDEQEEQSSVNDDSSMMFDKKCHLKLKAIKLPLHVLCPVYPQTTKQQPLPGYSPYHFYIPLDRAVRVISAIIKHVIDPNIFCPVIDHSVVGSQSTGNENETPTKSIIKDNILSEESIMKLYRSIEDKTVCLYQDGSMSVPEGLHSFIRSTMRLFICSPTRDASDLDDWRMIGEMYLKNESENKESIASAERIPMKESNSKASLAKGKKANAVVNPAFVPPDIDIDYQIQLDTTLNDVEKYTLMVDADHVQLLIIELLRKRMTHIDHCLMEYFEKGDLNHDHVLNFMEFESIIKAINHTCPERQIIRMFREALSMGNDNDCIGPNAFVDICKKFKIVDLVNINELQQNSLSALSIHLLESKNSNGFKNNVFHRTIQSDNEGHHNHDSTYLDYATHSVHHTNESISHDCNHHKKSTTEHHPSKPNKNDHDDEEDSEIEEQVISSVPLPKAIPPSTTSVVYMSKKKDNNKNRRILPMKKVDIFEGDSSVEQIHEHSIQPPSQLQQAPQEIIQVAESQVPTTRMKFHNKGPKLEVNEELSKESSLKMMKELRARQIMRYGGGLSDSDEEDRRSEQEDSDH